MMAMDKEVDKDAEFEQETMDNDSEELELSQIKNDDSFDHQNTVN